MGLVNKTCPMVDYLFPLKTFVILNDSGRAQPRCEASEAGLKSMCSALLARMSSCKGISDDTPISATASGEGLQAHQKDIEHDPD